MLTKEDRIAAIKKMIAPWTADQQVGVLWPFLPNKGENTIEVSGEVYLQAYNAILRVGICLECGHTLSMIETAVKRHENPERFLGKAAIKTTIDRAIVKYFTSIQEKEAYMQGIEDSRVMYDPISPETIDFLEQFLHNSPTLK